MKTKVRFNLAAGENFQKWQVVHPDGEVEHFDPSRVQLVMFSCFLRNQKATAQKIFEGANKAVCAWIECEGVDVQTKGAVEITAAKFKRLSYNPRVTPNWVSEDENVDGTDVHMIVSDDRKLFRM